MALMPVADALAAVLDGAGSLGEETLELEACCHRVLATDLAALRTQPPAAMSAMDGYALRAADAAKVPARLPVVGEVAAGTPFPRPLQPGEAVRIFTGGVIPDGADAVVIQEDTSSENGGVVIREAARAGRHIRPRGVDFAQGDVLLRSGRRLSDRDLSLAAAMNHPRLAVTRRPRLGLLATGDELVMPGTEPGPGQIVYSNGYAIRALARAEGADVTDLGVVGDTLEATREALRRALALGLDILVSTGGASVGDHDVVQKALAAEGVQMAFWKIAMRPGKPMMHGRLGQLRVLGLPGNPVSSYVCAVLFMVPLIRAMSGRHDVRQIVEPAVLGCDLAANDQREDYLRARLGRNDAGQQVATPLLKQDSSLLAKLSEAQALVIRSPHAPPARAGEPCNIIKLP